MRDPVIPYYTGLMTKLDTDRPCPQHHQPRSQCNSWDRHVHTMRFRDDDWEAAEKIAWAAKSDITTLQTLAMTVITTQSIRCYRCKEDAPPVPVKMGDLTGTSLREAVIAAEKQVVSQHPRHEPVMIGAAPPGHVAPATPEPLLRARARTRPGAAVFMEPGAPAFVTPVPEVPVRSKKGRG